MLLPYVSYLRVYERMDRLPAAPPGPSAGESSLNTVATITLVQEQQTILRRCVAPSAAGPQEDPAGCYLLQRNGRVFVCPLDLTLRSWLSLTTFVEDTDSATQSLFFVPDHAARAVDEFGTWRLANPTAVPHIRSATWGVPRTWFLMVTEDQREAYCDDGVGSVRFRTPLPTARTRLTSAHRLLGTVIGDEELMDELDDLHSWLTSFEGDGWLELDYAGVAPLLGASLPQDRSADDIQRAMAALERKDFAAAGEAYREFTERWRAVNALERAN